ncbi:hypothetical protein [Schleiferilactobacillus harbinensis]|uniref:hypothetical protein n=1 Tax=Schleiferilactobacillus harbinensis TaxID=304207 RepID=UPI001171CA6E|nr:hypothetical protein [Schleiferilactobacillus harbinensis]GEK06743.1 hypothetical protein LHA01_19820 [Schleiferilactobacillus harbinensis]
MTVHPGNEQEVIISYDKELNEWHYYGDVPTLNRKWQDLVDADRTEVEPNGTISVLEGTITGNVSIRRKVKSTATPEQRRAASIRMKELRRRQLASGSASESAEIQKG